jgi:hypothetical protein
VQLVTAVVSAVILAFSVAITGQSTNAISAYLTAGGIVAAFVSVFNSFRYTRLAKTFDDCVDDPDNVSTSMPLSAPATQCSNCCLPHICFSSLPPLLK